MPKVVKAEAMIKKLKDEIRYERSQIKKLKRSRIWRYSIFLRKVLVFLLTARKLLHVIKNGEKYIKMEDDLIKLNEKYKDTSEENKRLNEILRNKTVTENGLDQSKQNLQMLAKQAKETGELIPYLDHLVTSKKHSERYYEDAITIAARTFRNENRDLKKYVYTRALEGFNIKGFPEFLVREVSQDVELQKAASFSALLTMRARQKQLHPRLPEEILDNKQVAYQFVDLFNVRRPWVQSSYTKDDIPLIAKSVIKPDNGAGSRGVYLYFDSNKILDVKRGQELDSHDALDLMMEKDLNNGWVSEDKWLVEELITEHPNTRDPARDLKFYCFYGKVELILEVVRYPQVKYCWWNSNGERVYTGKYENELFKGNGVSMMDIKKAEEISFEIPAPFVRIDFLKSGNELVFGEFTPKPGNYDFFSYEMDHWLGDCYLRAQQSLVDDLVNGKQFKIYTTLTQDLLSN